MCTEVAVIKGRKIIYCQSVGELASALSMPPARISDDGPEYCLCNAHLEDLGARQATESEGWPFPEYIITTEAYRSVPGVEEQP